VPELICGECLGFVPYYVPSLMPFCYAIAPVWRYYGS